MNQPAFSVIMPTYLGDYKGAASNRIEKFHRAVDSVWKQALMNWELVIVVDGCPIAAEQAKRYEGSERIKVHVIPKQRRWGPGTRNYGLMMSTGAYAIYLDADDKYGPNHLLNVGNGLKATGWPKWGALDEWVWNKIDARWELRLAMPLIEADRKGGNGRVHAGTQNIVHRLDQRITWPAIQYRYPNFGYATEDRAMVAELDRRLGPPVYIAGADQYLMHAPNDYDL